MIKRLSGFIGLAGILFCSASHGSGVIINGHPLNSTELAWVESQLGVRIGPGNYLVDQRSGCWLNASTGQTGCIGSAGTYTSRYGSGERNANGDWSHWSNMAGGGVVGTGDGCVSAFGWSNC